METKRICQTRGCNTVLSKRQKSYCSTSCYGKDRKDKGSYKTYNRNIYMRELKKKGWSLSTIGRKYRITRQRVSQILQSLN